VNGMSPPVGSKIQLDAFVEAIPYAETRLYVVKVMGSMARYGYLAAGDAGVPVLDLAP
jgi:soluble lytic murein transglycosylase-like protein